MADRTPTAPAARGEPSPTVRVIFLDDGSGEVIGRSDVPLGQLPDELTGDTRLQLGETHWMITHADPPQKPVFTDTGVLRLRLRRLDAVDPRELLFSQPTICATLPEADEDAGDEGETLRLHEDDWRRGELVRVRSGSAGPVWSRVRGERGRRAGGAPVGREDELGCVGHSRLPDAAHALT